MSGTSIVQVNVSLSIPPTPETLQKTGALISIGWTNTTPWTYSLLTQKSDLTPLLATNQTISTMVLSGGVVTVTATNPFAYSVGAGVMLTISGVAPTAYNGNYYCTITSSTTFTYPLGGSPGSVSTQGSFIIYNVNELVSMANTFFNQGFNTAVYVLELGAGSVYTCVNNLNSYINANPNFEYTPGATGYFYSYLVPREWDGTAAYLNFLANFENPTSRTYFFTTSTLQTYDLYNNLQKCAFVLVESPKVNAYPANALTNIVVSSNWPQNALTAITCGPFNGAIYKVTATTTTPHTVNPGDTFTISGCVPVGYNGTFVALTGTTGNIILYGVVTSIGVETTLGTLAASIGGTVTATTTTNHGITPGTYFTISGTVPVDYSSIWLAMSGTTASTIVYKIGSVPANATVYGTLLASYYSNPGVPSTEFSCAAPFYKSLSYSPSSTSRITPFAFSFLFGVTPFPIRNNSSLMQMLKNSSVNWIGTGAEGGISDACLFWGTMLDGNDFTYWYSVDWVQINLDINTSNEVINGSNNPINPLYYNQPGINRLAGSASSTMATGIAYGLVQGNITLTALDGITLDNNLNNDNYIDQTVINAVPFITYSLQNPGDYKIGRYAGLSVIYMPLRGFTNIVYDVLVTEFIGQ